MRPLIVGVAILIAIATPPMLAQEDDTIYEPGNDVSLPKLVKEVKPGYTADAMRRRVTGSVHLTCVVDREGTPTNIEIVQPLDDDLDQVAVDALRQWRFEPGTKNGRPVLVRIQVQMSFTVGKRRR